MPHITPPPPPLHVHSCFSTPDPLLSSITIFLSLPPPTSTFSRCEAHLLSLAGFVSYPRLTLSPQSQYYAAVDYLPTQKQGSEVTRAIACALAKYFSEVPGNVVDLLRRTAGLREGSSMEGLGGGEGFDARHAADVAGRMSKLEPSDAQYRHLQSFLEERTVRCVDADVVLRGINVEEMQKVPSLYARGLGILGEESFLPTTRLKRTLSKPAAGNKRPELKDLDYAPDLEREISEFIGTEANYCAKLREFLEEEVMPARDRAGQISAGGGIWPRREEMRGLFPDVLDKIVERNESFYGKLSREDVDVERFAEICVESFPTFRRPYEEYITSSTGFPQTLAKLTSNRAGPFAKRVEEIGEQRLRSLLIEPVQRLPRYSLYIDNMLSMLPEDHPAVPNLTKARETVTEICSLQSTTGPERNRVVERLQALIPTWPARLRPQGRLITALDVIEILPPFHEHGSDAFASILLLFADTIVILRRPKSTSMVARAVQAEVDKPSRESILSARPGTPSGAELQFAGWIDLNDVRLSESDEGNVLWITMLHDLKDVWDIKNGVAGAHKFRLQNIYEGRAGKFIEEVAKSKLERRVAGLLGVREVKPDNTNDGLGMWIGVWGDEAKYRKFRPKSQIAIFFTDEQHGRLQRERLVDELGEGVEIACLVELGKQRIRLDLRSYNDYASSDTLSDDELLPVLLKRFSTLLYRHTLPAHAPITWSYISSYRRFLRSLGIPYEGESKLGRMLRPASPVKLLSSFLGSSGQQSRQLQMTEGTMLPPSTPLQRKSSRGKEKRDEGAVSIVDSQASELKRLETVFESFIEALRNEEDPDELSQERFQDYEWEDVDRFYDAMVKDPSPELGQTASAGVIFAALVQFVRTEWKDKMGVLLSRKNMDALQEKSDAMYLHDFTPYLRGFLMELTPQNRRAFRSIVKLLATLIQRVDNDADKGRLVASFTELLMEEDLNAMDYLPLVDRLVEDVEALFGDMPAQAFTADAVGINGYKSESVSSRSSKHNININTSVNSNTSLRKRFGFSNMGSVKSSTSAAPAANKGEEGKTSSTLNEFTNKASSILRTLSSKGHSHTKSHESMKKHFLSRSKSTDIDARALPVQKRPVERPGVRALFDNAPDLGPPGVAVHSGAGRPFSAIYEEVAVAPHSAPGRKKKRRSSLSDLISARQLAESKRLEDMTSTEEPPPMPEPTTLPQRSFLPLEVKDEYDPARVEKERERERDRERERKLTTTPPRIPVAERRGSATDNNKPLPSTPMRSNIPRPSLGSTNSPATLAVPSTSRKGSHSRNRSEILPARNYEPPELRKENTAPGSSGSGSIRETSLLPRRPSTQGSAPGTPGTPKMRVANARAARERSGSVLERSGTLREPTPTGSSGYSSGATTTMREKASVDLMSKIDDAEASLQAELDKIAKELAATNTSTTGSGRSRIGGPRAQTSGGLGRSNTTNVGVGSSSHGSSNNSSAGVGRSNTTNSSGTRPLNTRSATDTPAASISDLTQRVSALENLVSTTLSTLRSDVSQHTSQLRTTRRLLDEAQAENAALYDRFNTELGKIAEAVKRGGSGGEKVGEMVRVLEGLKEEEKLRAEVRRLRRELGKGGR